MDRKMTWSICSKNQHHLAHEVIRLQSQFSANLTPPLRRSGTLILVSKLRSRNLLWVLRTYKNQSNRSFKLKAIRIKSTKTLIAQELLLQEQVCLKLKYMTQPVRKLTFAKVRTTFCHSIIQYPYTIKTTKIKQWTLCNSLRAKDFLLWKLSRTLSKKVQFQIETVIGWDPTLVSIQTRMLICTNKSLLSTSKLN